jgi:hypothetical protein
MSSSPVPNGDDSDSVEELLLPISRDSPLPTSQTSPPFRHSEEYSIGNACNAFLSLVLRFDCVFVMLELP